MACWAVVMTKPRREQLALLNLQRQGFVCYLPCMREAKNVVPVFPRYLFVFIMEQWQAILHTFGISNVLRNGEQPAALGADFIESLKMRERNGLIVFDKKPKWRQGARVRVQYGHLAGRTGIYVSMGPRQRVIVLLDALGRVDVEEQNIIAA